MASFLNVIFSKKNKILSLNNGSLNFMRFEHQKMGNPGHRVNNLEKRFLVWTGKYKNVEDVPNLVAHNIVERARNRMRIRIANYMMVATVIGCIAMVYSGKQAAKRGESVSKQNIQWHQDIKDGKV